MADDNFNKPINTNEIVQSTMTMSMTYHINIDSEISSPSDYRQVYDTLRKANVNDKVFILINTPGGELASGVQLYNSILKCKAYVIAQVYEASSAGSILALASDEIQISDFGYMMIHSLSSGVFGKQEDLKNMTEFLCKWGNDVLSIYKGFLTTKEIEEVKKGKELWLSKQDVDKRLKTWIPAKSKK